MEKICPSCGVKFNAPPSEKKFCSQKCYIGSEQFKNMVIANNVRRNTKKEITCVECGVAFVRRRSRYTQKTCGRLCQRKWFAKRFDHFVQSIVEMGPINNFDEFLTQEELPCLVKGCEWVGRNLSMHMNMHHGIPADTFKEMAGFNKHTGVVCPDASEAISSHARDWFDKIRMTGSRAIRREKMRPEAKEHMRKARAAYLASR